MADDKIIKEEDDDPIIVEVEKLPTPAELAAKTNETPEGEDDDKPGEGDEDARLVADEDDDEDEANAPDAGTANHKARLKRRQRQKFARDKLNSEMAVLREQNTDFARQLSEIRGNQLSQSETQIDERLAKTREDINLADRIMAKAMEAGNGEDFIAAQNMRDVAKTAEFELLRSKGSVTDIKKNAPDPRVTEKANQFKAANSSWYGINHEATQIANEVEAQLMRQGEIPPHTDFYWQEVARRLETRFRAETPAKAPDTPKRKTPPPQGQSREHVPPSTRREVYVTPERKQAMVDAGIWDDVPRRNKMLKAYADFDREQSA